MKRVLSALLLLIAVLCAASSVLAAADTPSAWAKDSVAKAVAVGLVPAELQNNYTADMTRAEFVRLDVRFLASLYNVDVDDFLYLYCKTHWYPDGTHPAYKEHVFSDTNEHDINLARAVGLIAGYPDGTFRPDAAITRQEAAHLFINTYFKYSGGIKHGPKSLEFDQFKDRASVADWAWGDACYMYEWGILTGVGDGRFDPLGHLTREQCFVAFLRYCDHAPIAKYPTSPGSAGPLQYDDLVTDITSRDGYHLITRLNTKTAAVLYGTQDGPGGQAASLWLVWKDGGRRELLQRLVTDTTPLRGITLEDLRVIDDTTVRFTSNAEGRVAYYELNLTSASLTVLAHSDN